VKTQSRQDKRLIKTDRHQMEHEKRVIK
jgi:hypothetical protein